MKSEAYAGLRPQGSVSLGSRAKDNSTRIAPGMHWTMPVIMITTPGDESTWVSALENVAKSFFTKPGDFGVLNDYLELRIDVREVGL